MLVTGISVLFALVATTAIAHSIVRRRFEKEVKLRADATFATKILAPRIPTIVEHLRPTRNLLAKKYHEIGSAEVDRLGDWARATLLIYIVLFACLAALIGRLMYLER